MQIPTQAGFRLKKETLKVLTEHVNRYLRAHGLIKGRARVALFSLTLVFGHAAHAQSESDLNNALGSSGSSWLTLNSPSITLSAPLSVQNGGIVTISGTAGQSILNGNAQSGFFVQNGQLTLNNLTLTNFSTVGGTGSGGGAGLGGALFVNTGASATLNGVNFYANTVTGGTGGVGTKGGSLNNLFNNGPNNGSDGANGADAPTNSSYSNGGNGSNGWPGAPAGNGNPGTGGNGGNGGKGSVGTVASADTVFAAAEIAFHTAQAAIADAQAAAATAEAAASTAEAAGHTDEAAADTAEATEDTAEAADLGAEAAGEGAAEAEFTDAAAATAAAVGSAAGAVDDGLKAAEEGDKAAAEATDATANTTEATQQSEQAAEFSQQAAKETAEAEAGAAYLLALTETSEYNGTSGIGGLGGDGGQGGNGSFGNGGGAGGSGGDGGNAGSQVGTTYAVGGNGGNGANGGTGGFGAGGGAGGNGGQGGQNPEDTGDHGSETGTNGVGGNGGSAGFGGGQGMTGQGYQYASGGGDGGSGYGGAIFVAANGTLTITGTATFDGNDAVGGISSNSQNGGNAGQAAGTDLFMMTGSNVTLAPGAGNTITFNGTIADDSAGSIGGTAIPVGSGAGITIADGGTVIFNGQDTYSGQTKIEGGALQAQDGTGLPSNSNLNLAGGVFQSSGTFTRFLGTNSNRVQWTNSGGFAAVDGGLTVRLNAGQTLTWGSGSFVPKGDALLFGSESATDNVLFKNNLDLGGQNESILVTANSDNSDTATISGVISDGSLTVNDLNHDGTLILTGANTYTGGTTINNGTLVLGKGGSLAAPGAVVDNGTFDISQSANQTIGDLSGSGTVDLGAHKLTAGTADSTTFSGSLVDGGLGGGSGGSLVKQGTGTLTLTGANSYTGGTTVSAGTLALAGSGSLAGTGAVVDNATFDISQGGNQTIGDLSGSGTVNLGGEQLTEGTANSTAFSGTIQDGGLGGGSGGSLVKQGTGTLTLTGANSYTGGTTVSAGTLALAGSGSLAGTGAVVDNAIFDISQGGNQTIGDLSGSGTVKLGGQQLTEGTANNTTFSGTIQDGGLGSGSGGSLVRQGTGTLTLTGANSYTGGTTISAGTLALAGSGTLAATGAVVDNATFDISQGGNQTIGDLSGSGIVNLGGQQLTEGTANNTTFSGTIQDGGLGGGSGGSLVKQGAGTLTLTGANSYTGGTTVSAGTLALAGSGSLAATGAVVDNAIFDISQGGNQTIGDLSGSGTVKLGSQQLAEGTANSTTFSGTIQDGGLGGGNGGSLVKQGAGTLTLMGANSYTGGTTVSAGTLALAGSGSLAATGAVADNATFDISQGGNQTIGDLSGSGTVNLGGKQLTEGTANSTAFIGTIQDGGLGGGSGGSLVKQGSGALVLAGANSYTGGTTISAGTLALAGGGSLAATGAVVDNATFDISGAANQTIGDLSGSGIVNLGSKQLTEGTANSTAFTGTIQDGGLGGGSGGSLVKQGEGTLTLTGANSYTGGTTVNAGTLALAGSGSLAAIGAVADNATFDISQGGNQTIGDLSGSGTVKLGGQQLTAGTANSTTFSGTIQDGGLRAGSGGSVVKQGAGALTLTGANSYTGGTTVSAGTLALAGGGKLSATGAVVNNGTVDISQGGDQTIGDLSGSGTVKLGSRQLTVGTANSTTFSGSLADGGIAGGVGGSLVKQGTGTLTLLGTNTYTGGTTIVAGKLVLGQGASLAPTGSVVDNGTLDISQSGNQIIGALSGSGSLVLGGSVLTVDTSVNTTFSGAIESNGTSGGLITAGTGTLSLTGYSSYVGPSVLDSGTLMIGHSNALGTGTIVVAGEVTLTTQGGSYTLPNAINLVPTITLDVSSGVLTLSGHIFGGPHEGIVKTGAGDLTITGDNSYVGNTTLGDGSKPGGTLTVGSNTALGDSSNPDNAILQIATNSHATLTTTGSQPLTLANAVQLDNSDPGSNLTIRTGGSDVPDLTLAGTVTGVGGITKAGEGTLTLSGDNTYEGGTNVSGGTLVAGNSHALGTGAVVNAGTLQTGGSNHLIAIASGFTQTSSGLLKLNVVNSGTLAPAAYVTGAPVLNYDAVLVAGTANVAGSKVFLSFRTLGSALPSQGQRYTVLTSLGGPVVGQFDGSNGYTDAATFNPAFKAAAAYNDNGNDAVTLTMLLPFVSLDHLTANEQAVARYIDTYDTTYTTGDFADNVVAGLNLETYNKPGALASALNELSPQRLQVLSTIAFDNFTFSAQQLADHLTNLRDGVSGLDTSGLVMLDASLAPSLARIKSHLVAAPLDSGEPQETGIGGLQDSTVPAAIATPDRWGAFIDGDVILADFSHNQNVPQADYTAGGVMAGIDYRLTDHLTIGALFNYIHTDASLDGEGSGASIDSYQGGLYGAYAQNGWYANALATYGFNDDSTSRRIRFAGVDRTAAGNPSGGQYAGDIAGGYEFHLGRFAIGPSLGLDYVHWDLDRFTESGAGVASLDVRKQSADSLRSKIGLTARYQCRLGPIMIAPHLSAYWQHEYLDDSRNISSSFSQPGIGTFTVQTTVPGRDYALLDGGVDAQVTKSMVLYADAQAQVGSGSSTAGSIQAGLRIAF